MKKRKPSQRGAAAGDSQTALPPESRSALGELGLLTGPRVEVLKAIAQGGTGKVEAMFDHVLHRTVAKKSLLDGNAANPRKLRQFVREARITSQLDHPSVVPVHELGIDAAGEPYFSLKLVEGRTLYQLIDTWREVGVDEAQLLNVLDSLVKVCDALALAHSRGVVHCDVKPDNIIIGDYGETYLMDWGAATVLPSADDALPSDTSRGVRSRPTLPGDSVDDTIAGTPNYMAPEQAAGEGSLLGPHTDVFGVGATLYEVLTGQAPYEDVDEFTAIDLAERAWFTPLSALIEEEFIPPLLERVIDRSMAKAPEDRYATIDELKAELVRYLRGGREFPVVGFEPGTVVMREGDKADCAYIITRGRCEVVKDLDGEAIKVRVLGPGDVFGETALLSPGPRIASVVAIDQVFAQVIQPDVLTVELDSTRPWLAKVVRTVANRFREADAQLDLQRGLANPLQAAKQATMYLSTWGTPGEEDDSLEMSWSQLCRELCGDDPERVELLQGRLSSFEALRVDQEADRIFLTGPREFAAFLAGQLEL